MLAPVLVLGPGLLGLSPDNEPWAGSRRLEPRLKEDDDPPPDDFPGLEPALLTSWLFLGSEPACLGRAELEREDIANDLESGEGGEGAPGSRVSGHSSCGSVE